MAPGRGGNPAGRLGRMITRGINEQKRLGEDVQSGLPLHDLGRTAARGLQAMNREDASASQVEPDAQQLDTIDKENQ